MCIPLDVVYGCYISWVDQLYQVLSGIQILKYLLSDPLRKSLSPGTSTGQVLSEYFLVSEHRIMQCNSLSLFLLFFGQYLVVWTTVLILTSWAIISWSSLDCDP